MNFDEVNPFSLQSLPVPDRRLLPSAQGIYFVISENEEIEYIGGAENLFRRWQNHECGMYLDHPAKCRIAWFEFIGIFRERFDFEKLLISKFQPRINAQNKRYATQSSIIKNLKRFGSYDQKLDNLFEKIRLLAQSEGFTGGIELVFRPDADEDMNLFCKFTAQIK